MENYYELLNVAPKARQNEIELSFILRKTQLLNDGTMVNRNEYEKLVEAYEILKNPSLRRIYDFVLGSRVYEWIY